jgi:hypothetical protein
MHWASLRIKLKVEIVTFADETMQTACHAVTINLETVAQTRLSDMFTALNLRNQTMSIGNQFLINVDNVASHDGTEQ